MGDATRAPSATTATVDMRTATAMPMDARQIGCTERFRSPSRTGRRRSTRTKATSVIVSMSTCVSARSGAPCRAKSAAMP